MGCSSASEGEPGRRRVGEFEDERSRHHFGSPAFTDFGYVYLADCSTGGPCEPTWLHYDLGQDQVQIGGAQWGGDQSSGPRRLS